MKVAVSAVHDNGEIIQLLLLPSQELLAEQSRVTAIRGEQLPVRELHVTLASTSGYPDKQLPPPPAFVEFLEGAEVASRSDKTSTYLRVSAASQAELQGYVATLEKALGVEGLQNPTRVFHVSLSNLVGTPRASIAKVWQNASLPV